jgi:hypothetical protein
VTIFASPTVGEYSSIGASASGSRTENLGAPLGTISSADADQPHIRYNSTGDYEIELPAGSWQTLVPYGQGTAETVLSAGGAEIVLSGSKDVGYHYSELASWGSADELGAFAFGTLTPSGGVPTTGSAMYKGLVQGWSDVIASDGFDGPNRTSVDGTVSLDFNFGTGSLSGAMKIGLNDAAGDALSLGTFDFKDTVFSTGSTSYSGKFDTSASGQNWFLGQFTGPNAEETIGAWALPFVLDVGNNTITADHLKHQAFGGWIAKQAP